MTGVVNQTGARSGIVGTNVGTPAATNAADVGAGVLPVGVTGGSGLTALGTVTAGNLSNTAIVYPAGHVIQTVGDIDNTARSTTFSATALLGVAKTITSTVANSNFFISGTCSCRNVNGHFMIGIYKGGLTNTSHLIFTPSHRDSAGSGNGWYGWYITGRNSTDSSTNPATCPSVSYVYDPGTHSVGTAFDFKIGMTGYSSHTGQTNVSNAANGFSSIIIQELAP
jgi:hypothetical protein